MIIWQVRVSAVVLFAIKDQILRKKVGMHYNENSEYYHEIYHNHIALVLMSNKPSTKGTKLLGVISY